MSQNGAEVAGVVGRPRLVTAEIAQKIATFRSEGLSWPAIGQRLGLKPETCRRALWVVRNAPEAVGNPPALVKNHEPGN
jgi:hypothetical protein